MEKSRIRQAPHEHRCSLLAGRAKEDRRFERETATSLAIAALMLRQYISRRLGRSSSDRPGGCCRTWMAFRDFFFASSPSASCRTTAGLTQITSTRQSSRSARTRRARIEANPLLTSPTLQVLALSEADSTPLRAKAQLRRCGKLHGDGAERT